MTRRYEAMFLLTPREAGHAIGLVSRMLSRAGATGIDVAPWGDRRLAYGIDDHHSGVFVLARFGASADVIRGTTRDANVSDSILRLLIIQCNDRAGARSAAGLKKNPPALRALCTSATNEGER